MLQVLFFVSILVLSQAATLVRFADANSFAICFWRLLIAAVFLSPLALKKTPRRELRNLAGRDWGWFLLAGGFLFAHFYLFFLSVQQTTVANSTILFSLNPVTTAIGAYFVFRERVTLHLALACGLGLAGVLVLFSESLGPHSTLVHDGFWGDLWGVLAPLFFSGYVLTGKHVRRKLSNSVFAMVAYLQCALFSAVAMLALHIPFTGYSQQTRFTFLALAVFPTLLGHAIFSYCLEFMNVNFMSRMTLVEPVFAAAVAIWLFHEPLTGLAALGFVLSGAAVVALYWNWLSRSVAKGFS